MPLTGGMVLRMWVVPRIASSSADLQALTLISPRFLRQEGQLQPGVYECPLHSELVAELTLTPAARQSCTQGYWTVAGEGHCWA